jgi:hypothetical protein
MITMSTTTMMMMMYCKILITASKKENVVQVRFDFMAENKPILLTDMTNYILLLGFKLTLFNEI